MERRIHSVCVFCGSSVGEKTAYTAAAREVAESLARRKLRLVYGGGKVGLMGQMADAAVAAGVTVVGVIPRRLAEREVAHQGLAELLVVETMHARKALMADLSDAFVALPGGFGTLDEFFEIVTWAQLGFHSKPVGLINVEGFFDPVLSFVDYALREGFVRPEHRRLILVANCIEELLDQFAREANPP
jgi:uncharacterized protein (TIGR00730 family)